MATAPVYSATAAQECLTCQGPLPKGRGGKRANRKYCSYRCSGVAFSALRATQAVERFWAKVNQNGPVIRPELGPCWVWTAYVNSWNQPMLSVRGKGQLASRFAYTLVHGEIPPRLFVLHHCDNARCVRPEHLYLGDHARNMADMKERGRAASHERQGAAKLTESQVAEIRSVLRGRARFENGEASELARRFGVSVSQIGRVARFQAWR